MNQAEHSHVLSMARHIKQHAARIVGEMEAIESIDVWDIPPIPVAMMTKKLAGQAHSCKEIEQVLADMMPRLRELEAESKQRKQP